MRITARTNRGAHSADHPWRGAPSLGKQETNLDTHTRNDLCLLTDEELDVVTGSQQLYAHEFAGAVNSLTGLRPGEPSIVSNDPMLGSVPLGSLFFYGSTENNLP